MLSAMYKRFAFAGLTVYVLVSAMLVSILGAGRARLDLLLPLLVPGLLLFIGLAIWATRRGDDA